jgi:hypothetical protein
MNEALNLKGKQAWISVVKIDPESGRVYYDEEPGTFWVVFNNPNYIADRSGFSDGMIYKKSFEYTGDGIENLYKEAYLIFANMMLKWVNE